MGSQRGFTLVELVISIVVIGIAVAGVLTVMNRTVSASADPMVQHQAIAIAEAYMEEILTKSYAALPGSGSRDAFDDVMDYNPLNDSDGARDQFGKLVPGLEGYSVIVDVGDPVALNSGVNARQITVKVTPPSGPVVTLDSYRAAIP